jgi:hypothetical protein
MMAGDGMVQVWSGDYEFARDGSFFPAAARLGDRYGREPDKRPPEAKFRRELERLQEIAPAGGRELLDQIEHRWMHPDCPPALYVLNCTLQAPHDAVLQDENRSLVQELRCTKVGKAKSTVAARLHRYMRDPLGGVRIVPRSHSLRLLVWGHGSSMILEREIQHVAQQAGPRAMVVEAGAEPWRVGSETFAGLVQVETLATFARGRAVASSPSP